MPARARVNPSIRILSAVTYLHSIRTRLNNSNCNIRVLRQPCRNAETSRSTSDDYVVIVLRGELLDAAKSGAGVAIGMSVGVSVGRHRAFTTYDSIAVLRYEREEMKSIFEEEILQHIALPRILSVQWSLSCLLNCSPIPVTRLMWI